MAFDEQRYRDLLTKAWKRIQELEDLTQKEQKDAIAIVGTAFRFPGNASDEASFWEMLTSGHDVIGQLPERRWDSAYDGMSAYYGGYLQSVYDFDFRFFGFAPEEAEWTDPQQRLMLEISAEAITHAGYSIKELSESKTGVFVGVAKNNYSDVPAEEITEYLATGSSAASVAGRISYFFNFHGPSVSIDTTCSSSLTAIYQAVNSLNANDCELALAGGINLILQPEGHIGFDRLGIVSPSHRCSPFDAHSDGIVRAEGCGVIVLKRLSKALSDKDRILGVIRGIAVNHDGSSNGFTAPSRKAQSEVIAAALKNAGTSPAEVTYVEAHGTGTALGDIIELQALNDAYGISRAEAGDLLIGSVKANIGHSEFAAGMAGLIKILLCFRNENIPAQINFSSPTPRFNWDHSGLQVARQTPWLRSSRKRIAGISSFGITGTNVHLIIEEPPARELSGTEAPQWLTLALSAKSPAALAAWMQQLQQRLEQAATSGELYRLLYRVQRINSHFPARTLLVAASRDELIQRAGRATGKGAPAPHNRLQVPKMIFVFPGQGAQYPGMGRTLLQKFPAFSEAFSNCRKLILSYGGPDIGILLMQKEEDRFRKTDIQYLLFAWQYATASLWMSFGWMPDAVMGLSMGELTASCISGLLSLEETVRILTIRTGTLQNMETGKYAMAILEASEEELNSRLPLYGGQIEISVYGSQHSHVVSGPATMVEALVDSFAAENRFARKIATSVVSHCREVEPYMPSMVSRIGMVTASKQQFPLFSTSVTDWWDQRPDATYWHGNVRRPVSFARSTEALLREGFNIFVEMNPHPGISYNLAEIAAQTQQKIVHVASSYRTEDEYETFLGQMELLYKAGKEPQWECLFPQAAPFAEIPLPAWDKRTFKREYGRKYRQEQKEALLHIPGWEVWKDEQQPAGTEQVVLYGDFSIPVQSRDFIIAPEITDLQGNEPVRIVTDISWLKDPETFIRVLGQLRSCSGKTGTVGWILLQPINSSLGAGARDAETRDAGVCDAEARAALAAKLAEVAAAEEDWLRVRVVETAGNNRPGFLENEIRLPFDRFSHVRLDGNRRMVPSLRVMDHPGQAFVPDNEGIYLISGGTGGVGLQTALFLAAKGTRRIALLSRGHKRTDERDSLSPDRLAMTELEKTIPVLEYLRADISDRAAMIRTLEELRQRYGRISGVFHCAGALGEAFIRDLRAGEAKKAMAAKVEGALLLHELTLADKPTHFVLYSSVSSLFNTPSLGTYSASNAFLNAFAEWRKKQNLPALSIVWSLWKESGIAFERGQVSDMAFKALSNKEVHQVLEQTLNSAEAVIVAGRLNDSPAFAAVLDPAPFISGIKAGQDSFAPVTEPGLSDRPGNDTREVIRAIWAEYLGNELISDEDNFFHLGGNSILATRITNRIKSIFPGLSLTVADVLRSLTIARLAELADSRMDAGKNETELHIRPLAKQDRYPASNEQKRFWLQAKTNEDPSFNNLTGSYRLKGALEISALERAFSLILEENEILRTTYWEEDGTLFQTIHDDAVFRLTQISCPTEEEALSTLHREFSSESQLIFKLQSDYPLRGTVIRITSDPNLHYLLLNIHHIAADGWAMGQFTRKLDNYYRRLLGGEDVSAAIPAISYKDYSASLSGFLNSEAASLHRQYWKDQLAGAHNQTYISPDLDRTAGNGHKGMKLSDCFSAALTEKLQNLSEQQNSSLFTVLLAAFKSLLHKLSGATDILVGTVVSGREHPALENQVGNFMNLLPLRTEIGGNDSFTATIRSVSRNVLDSFEHRIYPFDRMLEDLKITRELSRHPLFDYLFIFQNHEEADLRLEGIETERLQSDPEHSKIDILFELRVTGGKIQLNIEYNTALYRQATIENLRDHFENLLEALCEKPEQPLCAVKFGPEEQLRELTLAFNSPIEAPVYPDLFTAFEAVAKRNREAIAVVQDSTVLTYEDLLRHSLTLAGEIAAQSDEGEVCHACAGNSAAQIIALLAIMRAGRIYCPLNADEDTGTLREKVRRHSGASLWIADGINVEKLKSAGLIKNEDRIVVLSGSGEHCWYNGMSGPFEVAATGTVPKPSQGSYLVFTSGTTGKPKGILGRSDAVTQFADWEKQELQLGKGVRTAWITRFTFDASFRDLFVPLLSGGTVSVPPVEIQNNMAALAGWLQQSGANVLHLVPSVFRALFAELKTLGKRWQPAVVLLAGEKIRTADAASWQQFFPATLFYNLYGPSETTMVRTFHKIGRNLKDYGAAIPAGIPIWGTKTAIVTNSRMCAPGEVGEVLIKTPFATLGYFHDVVGTKRVFIQNPLNPDQEDPVYKTGDLGRINRDGQLEITGRTDHQVKINGIRVELSAIEDAIVRLEEIGQVVVLLTEDEQLTALFTSGSRPDAAKLKQKLEGHLAPGLIPLHFVQLDNFPLNAHGKIDRRKLSAFVPVSTAEGFRPANPNQEKICALWKELTGSLPASQESRFFEAGGNSLTAMVFIGRLKKAFGTTIGFREFFLNPTVAAIEKLILQEPEAGNTEIPPLPKQKFYELSHAQHRMWVLHQMEENPITYNLKRAFVFDGIIDRQLLERALDLLVTYHESLRTNFLRIGDQVFQTIHEPGEHRFRMDFHDLTGSALQEEELQRIANNEAWHVFNLEHESLFRVYLVKLQERRHALLFCLHHIIADGWTMDKLLLRLQDLYDRLAGGEPVDPESPRIQYKDFAAWQNKMIGSETISAHKAYWLDQFKGEIPVLELPFDFPRQKMKSYAGEPLRFKIDALLTRKVRECATGEHASLFMLLFGAVNILLHKYTGQTDLIVGSPVAGRNHYQLEELAGFFVNTVALRTKPDPDDSFSHYLQSVIAATVDAYEHQLYPFDCLVDDLNLERDVSRSPLFDVTVQLLNVAGEGADTRFSLGGVRAERYFKAEWKRSQFDLSFFFREEEGGLFGVLEYNNGIYSRERAQRMIAHLTELLGNIAAAPGTAIKDLRYIPGDELRLLESWSEGNRIPAPASVLGSLDDHCRQHPQRTALKEGAHKMSYAAFDRMNRQLASFLFRNTAPQAVVAVLSGLKTVLVPAMAGIFRSHRIYLPLDSGLPFERLKFMLRDARAECLITDSTLYHIANRLQTETGISHLLCPDTDDPLMLEEPVSELMTSELWSYVAGQAKDDIELGGWKSSFTGQAFSREEMDEYAANVYEKLKPWLNSSSRVLEIGCSSGISLFRIAPHVGFYYGTDLSADILRKTQKEVEVRGLKNVKLEALAAHEITPANGERYDVIILNSVIQSFSGYNYLHRVMETIVALAADQAVIFLGDLQDLDRKDRMTGELLAFKRQHGPEKYTTKTDWSAELFVSREMIEDYRADFSCIAAVEHSEKYGKLQNELSLYRFDSLLHIDKTRPNMGRRKRFSISGKQQLNQTDTLPEVNGDETAYLIYTSGTTGYPKGVAVSHHSLSNFTAAMTRLFQNDFTAKDKVMLITAPTFDVSLFETWTGLCNGASLIAYDAPEISAREIASFLVRNRITLAYIHPGLLDEIAGFLGQSEEKPLLNKLLVGVEPILQGSLKKYQEILPGIRIINGYGPTETTVCATAYPFVSCDQEDTITPIGRPLDQNTVRLADKWGNPVPVGIPGRLFIKGAGVAQGYPTAPELTANSFISDKEGNTWYDTGDYACWLPAGNLKFMGRKDSQVKVRGYRIELAEIRNTLRKIAGIEKSEVLVTNNRIVCFYVSDNPVRPSALAEELALHLPAYMVPGQMLQVGRIPLNRHGKTDTAKLLDQLSAALDRNSELPVTKTEMNLLSLFRELLQVNDIGVTHNFFESGGHSVIAIRLVSKAYNRFKYNLQLIDVFTSPTVRQLAQKADMRGNPKLEEITAGGKQDHYPLSDAQKRLWIIDKQASSDSERSSYNMTGAFRIVGSIRLDWFEKAINQVIQKYEILRTRFIEVEGEARQQVCDQFRLSFHHSVIQTEDKEPEALIEQAIDRESAHVFDLSSGQLIRCSHFCFVHPDGNETRLLVMVMHHIISDGWSMNVFAREVFNSFSLIAEGGTGELPQAPIQYRDYTLWYARQAAHHPLFSEQKTYWEHELAGGIEPVRLPFDRERQPGRSMSGRTLRYRFSAETTRQLTEFIRTEHDLTRFMLLSGSVAILMSRISYQEDIFIGTPVAGRISPMLEDQIGFYLNNLVLKMTVDNKLTAAEFLHAVREKTVLAFQNQEYPFNRVLEDLARQSGNASLFNVYVALQNIEQPEFSHNSSKLIAVSYERKTSRFDLNFMFDDKEDRLTLQLQYNDNLFQRQTIENYAGYLENILRSLTARPDGKLEGIMLGKPEEERRESRDAHADTCLIHRIFEKTVDQYPRHTALVLDPVQLSYERLDRQASQISNGLIDKGILPGMVVGLCYSRSVEMVAAILGVLKAGAAYLPIDPSSPQSRIDFMLEDTKAAVVITDRNDKHFACGRLCASDFLPYGEERPGVEFADKGPAYIIYTSGSTGSPKGVAISHRNLYSILFENGIYQFNRHDTWTLFHNYTFDFSVWEIFGALVFGGKLVIVTEEVAIDTDRFAALVSGQGVTVLNQTPGAFYNFIDRSIERQTALPHLKMVIFGGDKLIPSRLRQWHRHYPGVRLMNMYGITETTIHVTCKELSENDLDSSVSNIGRAVSSLKTVILDQANNPVPDGIPGQLGVMGKGVASGYLNDPELTERKFVCLPFSEGQPVYLSGDLCRRLPGGDLEYMGRIDNQVKVRGHRIELGEIESVLLNYPVIEQAIVLKPEEEEQLVAFVKTGNLLPQRPVGEGQRTTLLPNMLPVFHNNQYETDFLYTEIFRSASYVHRSIKPFTGGVVIDVGANIGLYSIYAALNYPDSAIYAFEPVEPIFRILERNAALYSNMHIRPFGYGFSDRETEAPFIFYPNNSVLSGKHHDIDEDKQIVKVYLRNTYRGEEAGTDEEIGHLVDERMQALECTCKLRRLSDFITEQGITSVNLLKVDVEKSELEVLMGIDARHWRMIDQVILEVHDRGDILGRLESLLRGKGFEVYTEEEERLAASGLYNVFACKPGLDGPPYRKFTGKLLSPEERKADILKHCSRHLPAYMVPGHLQAITEMPLTSNGKTDRKKLLALYRKGQDRTIEAPANEVEEKLLTLWKEVLKKDEISVTDDFFETGGHSLNATQLTGKMTGTFRQNISISDIFSHTTIRQQADLLATKGKCRETEKIEPAPESDFYPVSPQQKQLIVSAGLESRLAKTAYNITGMLQIRGKINIGAVRRSFSEIIRRHEILRTVFRINGARYVQKVCREIPEVVFVGHVPDPLSDTCVREQYQKAAAWVFDLSSGPLIRVELLVKPDETETLFVLNMHHIICDGVSMININREFRNFYEAYALQRDPQQVSLPIQYKDYSVWYSQLLDDPEKTALHERHWRERLIETTPKTGIPGSLSDDLKFEGSLYRYRLDAELTNGLKQNCRQEITLYSQLLVAVQLLISRYTLEETVTVGVPVAGRLLPELETQIGFYVNTLPFRVKIKPDEKTGEFLSRAAALLIRDFEHQLLPLDRIVELFGRKSEGYGNNLFDTLVILQNAGEQIFPLNGLDVMPVELSSERSIFDLSFIFRERDDHIELKLQYNKNKYSVEDLDILTGYLISILRAFINEPSSTIENIAL